MSTCTNTQATSLLPSQAGDKNNQQSVCTVVGASINSVTTAVILASTGQVVHFYADGELLANLLSAYAFEHHVQALWQLYVTQGNIVVYPIPEQVEVFFSHINRHINVEQNTHYLALIWLFYSELPQSWQDKWVVEFNQQNSQINSGQTPLALSGIEPIGTFDKIAKQLKQAWVYYVPFVFLQDGQAFASMLHPSLWLLGEKTKHSAHKLSALQPLMRGAEQQYTSDILTIEFARNSIMTMLATRVSFMNECSRLADSQGVDITEVATIMGLDKRIGKSYLKAGWGFGGKTLPTEMTVLSKTLAQTQTQNRLMHVVNEINEDQKELIFRKFWQYFDGMIEGKTVSIWGVSYKAGSGSIIGSAIHPLLKLLWSYGITTQVYAEQAQAELANLYADQPLLTLLGYPEQALENAQAILVMSWAKDKYINIGAINQQAIPIFDAQNVFTSAQIAKLVGYYVGIGRSKMG